MSKMEIAHRNYENGKIITVYCNGIVTVTSRDGKTIKVIKGSK